MKKWIAIAAATLLVGAGCNAHPQAGVVPSPGPEHSKENVVNNVALTTQLPDVKTGDESFQFSSMDFLTPIYDEHDNLTGYLVKAVTSDCGSDCVAKLLLINTKNGAPYIQEVGNFESDSLGFSVYEEDKYTYLSSFIWGSGEGHFGCHYFKIQRLKYVNGKPEVLLSLTTKNKYAFDQGDAQGQCALFPGIKNVLNSEKLFK